MNAPVHIQIYGVLLYMEKELLDLLVEEQLDMHSQEYQDRSDEILHRYARKLAALLKE